MVIILASTLAAGAAFAASMYVGKARDVTTAPALRHRTGEARLGRFTRWVQQSLTKARGPSSPDTWEEVFYSLAFQLRAGATLPQAMIAVSEEGSDFARKQLARAVRAYQAGAPMSQAIQNLASSGPELHRLYAAVDIGLSTGSDLPALLCHSAELLGRRRALRMEARAKMTESRLTAVLLSAMPWLIGLITYRYDPTLLTYAVSTQQGRFVIGASVVLWAIGNVAIALTLRAVALGRGS